MSFSFVVFYSVKLPHIFIIFLSLCRNFIFCDHLSPVVCFSHCLLTAFLENSLCGRKHTFILYICGCFWSYWSMLLLFWFDGASPQFGHMLIGPVFRGCSYRTRLWLFSWLPGLLIALLISLKFLCINNRNETVT